MQFNNEVEIMFSSNQLVIDDSQYLRLAIAPSIQEKAWNQAQYHSNAIARHNAYLNYISLYTMIHWFTDEEAEPAEIIDQPAIYPSENSLPSVWEVVNGAGIMLGEKKIIVIPSEIEDLEEFCVPQEWVDIPDWAGDYYLAIQVNLEPEEDECWIEICGFTTHRYLKAFGDYSQSDRTYRLTLDKLNQDIAVIEVALPLRMQAEIPKLPKLLESQAQKLLDILSDSSIYTPRLRVNHDVTFEQWAGLIVNQHWRQQLYTRRIDQLAASPITASINQVKNLSSQLVHLTNWFQSFQPIVDFIDEWLINQPQLKLVPVRGQIEAETISENDVARAIRILQSHKTGSILKSTAEYLGEIAAGTRNQAAIRTLIQLIDTTKDAETRWQAAFSLGKIDPGNPQSGIEKCRLIDLQMQLSSHQVILKVGIMPKDDQRMSIWLSVKPHQETELPPDLKLSVLSESGEPITKLEVSARIGDRLISRVFNAQIGSRFLVQLTLNEATFTQEFLV